MSCVGGAYGSAPSIGEATCCGFLSVAGWGILIFFYIKATIIFFIMLFSDSDCDFFFDVALWIHDMYKNIFNCYVLMNFL